MSDWLHRIFNLEGPVHIYGLENGYDKAGMPGARGYGKPEQIEMLSIVLTDLLN
jgi:hypothetical protein